MSESRLTEQTGWVWPRLDVFVEPGEDADHAVRREVFVRHLQGWRPRVVVVHCTSRRGDEHFTRREWFAPINKRKWA